MPLLKRRVEKEWLEAGGPFGESNEVQTVSGGSTWKPDYTKTADLRRNL